MRTKSTATFVAVLTALTLFSHAHAQTNSPPPLPPVGRPGSQGSTRSQDPVSLLGKELNLDTNQQSKVQAVVAETREKIRAAVQQAMTNADAQLQRILTPEQYQKLQEIEHGQQRSKADNQGSAGPGLDENNER